MNAYELADIQAFKTEELTIWERNTTATMLRQQQAEIEALKQIIDANNLNQNIGQFVKPTNEPVAWMDKETGCFVYSQYDYEDLDEHGKDGLIPLYTHPVKEQDAIRYRWLRAEFEAGRETYLAEGMPSGERLDEYIDEQLRKAQEK